ncbi:MAG: UDP-N-acetylmuramoyl-L-alanine--D-glutamate ligase, partial [Candidatus Wildermuthbacteria bacterium]|nr:UDP-N-acetylmuramoyl-L-alanine--D-glutamate ligase [Candidatus Wildermuthbacteria bacterium]
MKLEEFEGKKVLILGFGREGSDTFSFLKKRFPEGIFGVADKKNISDFSPALQRIVRSAKGIALHLGADYLKAAGEYDIIARSPGVPLRQLKPFLPKGGRVTSQADIFLDECKGTVVGVTGTKGKSTVASLIHAVLSRGGKRAHLVGNIGKPALSLLASIKPEDAVVYELSSFQLMGLKKSP